MLGAGERDRGIVGIIHNRRKDVFKKYFRERQAKAGFVRGRRWAAKSRCFASHCDARQRSCSKSRRLASYDSVRRAAARRTHQEERCHTQTGQQLYAVDASLARRSRHAQPTGKPHIASSRRGQPSRAA